jgi:hypothetical protein
VNNMAYVGNGKNGLISVAARIQVTEPGRGAHLLKSGKPYLQETGAFYLVDNPSYNYYWVDYSPSTIVPNVVKIRATGANSPNSFVGRLQEDGQTKIGFVSQLLGLLFLGSDNVKKVATNYQVLACDPKPVNLCSKFCF